jgi:hypothetical protein
MSQNQRTRIPRPRSHSKHHTTSSQISICHHPSSSAGCEHLLKSSGKIIYSIDDYQSSSLDNSRSSSSLGSPLTLSLEDEFVDKVSLSQKKPIAVQRMISQLVQDEARHSEIYRKEAIVSIFTDDLMNSLWNHDKLHLLEPKSHDPYQVFDVDECKKI